MPDILQLTGREVRAMVSSAGLDEARNHILDLARSSDARALSLLAELLEVKDVSQMALQALIAKGAHGIETVRGTLSAPRHRVSYGGKVVLQLWRLGRGEGLTGVHSWDALGIDPPLATVAAASQAVRDLFSDALTNEEVASVVAHAMFTAEVYQRDMLDMFAESSIRISRSLLSEFRELVQRRVEEEVYQQFLTAHPVLLDPLAASIEPKQRLGLEYATDFAVRRHDGRWVLVEIERPQDGLFTKGDDLRERFNHAFGQVLDFQHWVDDNVAYAQKLMPGISAPSGLVVMGMRDSLTERQRAKLRQFTENSRRIEVVTYDDLLQRGEALYASLRRTGSPAMSPVPAYPR